VSFAGGQLEVIYPRSVLSRWVMGLPKRDLRALGTSADVRLVDGVVNSPATAGQARQALALARRLQPPPVVALEMALARIEEGDSSLGIRQFTTLLEALEQQDKKTPISADQHAGLLRLARGLEGKTSSRWLRSETSETALSLVLASPPLQPARIAKHLGGLSRDRLADAVFNQMPKGCLVSVLPLLAPVIAEHPHDILAPLGRLLLRESSADLLVVAVDLARHCGTSPPEELADSFRQAVHEQPVEVAILVIDACLELRVSLPPEPVRVAIHSAIAAVTSTDDLAASAARCLLDEQLADMGDDVVCRLLREAPVEALPRVVALLLKVPTKKHGALLSARATTAESTLEDREGARRIRQILEEVDPRRAAGDYVDLLDGGEQAVLAALRGLRRVGDLPELDAIRRKQRGFLTARTVRELARSVEAVILKKGGKSGRLGLAADPGDLSFARVEGALSNIPEDTPGSDWTTTRTANETLARRLMRLLGWVR